ncbi:MAG: alanine--glyoxylate aminotransferase family protein [Austwickia sp.]|nr:aminotransferase class V-fold PLP-dependent enzyme [Actinomycetota bacterium]MCB1253675.1 alanine--glyoxylate aminotransferase family protein [Austwickia sp.]
MTALRPDIDPDGLLEFSVVYTDRALNHMSKKFIGVMQEIIAILKEAYGAHTVGIVPGSGTTGMEAVVRQFARGKKCLVVRNGFFSYRWSQILEMGGMASEVTVCTARQVGEGPTAPFAPAPIEEVVAAIRANRPDLVFAPHVETASGIILPDDYLAALSAATHEVGGLFVLDCIAAGTVWADMRELGIDILVTAPQKGWSGSPCGAFVMLGERARAVLDETTSDSFAMDLRKWVPIAEGYVEGKHAYHATMPTDALAKNALVMREAREKGLDVLAKEQWELGTRVRELLAARGFASVAAPGFEAPGVVVCYTDDPQMKTGAKFATVGVQAAAGVPLMCGEPADFSTFRLGLFGLDKWADVDGCVARLGAALDEMGYPAIES